MSIDFGPERWAKVKQNYGLWWAGQLDRPLVPIVLHGVEPARPKPNVPLLTQATCGDLSISPASIIDRIEYELERMVFLGDSFPFFNMDVFGPGVVAAFLGADLCHSSTGQVWFHPKEVVPIKDLHFTYQSDNVWLNRIKEIYYEGMKRWQGQVLLGMVDLGGVLDIISTFRPGEALLLDLYDYPEEVERLVWEVFELWHRYYDELNSVLQPVNPGYSDWGHIYSETPSYMLQSDFSYMISPQMFEQFAIPELRASCQRLHHSMYHLDGVGQLPHLDALLQIKELDGVQWQPGIAKKDLEWPEVYRKIHASGKLIQILHGLHCMDAVIRQIGTHRGIHHRFITMPLAEEKTSRALLAKYGVE